MSEDEATQGDVEPKRETIDTIRLANTTFELLTPLVRDVVAEHGYAGLRYTRDVLKMNASIERDLFSARRYASLNAKQEMGIIDADTSTDDEADVSSLREDLDDRDMKLIELQQEIRRLRESNKNLLAKLAAPAMAAHSGGGQQ